MGVSREEVRKIAELARLHPAPESLERMTSELNDVLGHIRLLEEVDVRGVDEGVTGEGTVLPFRDPGLHPDPLAPGAPASGAPDWREGFFVLPRLPALDGGSPAGGGA